MLVVGNSNGSAASLFTIDSLSRLDLTDNDLVVRQGSLQLTTNLLTAGYHGAVTSWSGYGILSSKAAGSQLTTLGVKQITTTQTTDSQTLAAGDLLIKFTDYGDANLSGAVDGSDYSLLDYGFLAHQTGWQSGDFNYDGHIDGSDYTLADNAFNTQNAAPLAVVATTAIATSLNETNTAAFSTTPVTITWPATTDQKSHARSVWLSLDSR